jgi:HPr kinase/phosphorylase
LQILFCLFKWLRGCEKSLEFSIFIPILTNLAVSSKIKKVLRVEQKFSVNLSYIIEKMTLEPLYLAQNDPQIESSSVNRPGLQITGFFDFFNNEQIQVFGMEEMTYLRGIDENLRRATLDKLFSLGVPAFVIARNLEIFPEMLEFAKKHDVSLLKTGLPTTEFIGKLVQFLGVELAPHIRRHGVFIEVYGEGVLTLGESGIGKTETAIELMKRGHRLISDDAVDLRRTSSETIIGSAPKNLKYFAELRGIGIVDVKNIFGIGSVKDSERVDLVISLENWDEKKTYERLGLVTEYVEILGVKIPQLTIPVRPGRNLATIFEIAVMNNKQRKMGYNAVEELNRRISEENGEKHA